MARQVSIADIRIDGRTQMRQQIDNQAVDDYANAFKAGADFPPVKVFHDGKDNWLADGFHRWHAAKQAGLEKIKCDVEQGSLRDAILYAVGANRSNGMRRTNGDKRVCVMTLLHDVEWCKRSDRWIAEKCGVSHPAVAEYRKQCGALEESSNGNLGKRECADGRSYPTKRSKAKAADLHVPPIDEEIAVEPTPRPLLMKGKPLAVTAPAKSFEAEHSLVRALADLSSLIKRTHYDADIDKGRIAHELNELANEVAEAIEAAEAA